MIRTEKTLLAASLAAVIGLGLVTISTSANAASNTPYGYDEGYIGSPAYRSYGDPRFQQFGPPNAPNSDTGLYVDPRNGRFGPRDGIKYDGQYF